MPIFFLMLSLLNVMVIDKIFYMMEKKFDVTTKRNICPYFQERFFLNDSSVFLNCRFPKTDYQGLNDDSKFFDIFCLIISEQKIDFHKTKDLTLKKWLRKCPLK